LGLTNNPIGGGAIEAVLVASDGLIYVGGNFTGMNNVAGRDYIASYNPITDTWATVGGGGDFNASVGALAEGPDGIIYAGGNFTNCAGNPNADKIAQWNGVVWSNVGVPQAGAAVLVSVDALLFARNGDLYIGGSFTNWANIANADYFVSWDGAAYAAIGAGGTGQVLAIAEDSNGNIYIGGVFLNWNADANADRWAWWNGTTWASVNGIALNSTAFGMLFTSDDILYVCGAFTDAGGITTADYIFSWNGNAVTNLGTGLTGGTSSNVICLGPDGILYAGGNFTSAGGITLSDGVAKWNGSSWAHLDVDLPGVPASIFGIGIADSDPIIPENYDVYLGLGSTGGAELAGTATVTNDGTRTAYPRVIISRTGGTSATLKQIRNETTGKELLFDYNLLDGETLTIDLRPTRKSIVSNFFGPRPDAILPNSDFGEWALLPGANQVTCFVDVTGVPTIFAYLLWEDTYWSVD